MRFSLIRPLALVMAIAHASPLALVAGFTPAFAAGTAAASPPATVRLDYSHSGNALTELYAIERVVIEALPWPGDLSQAIDHTDRGTHKVEVVDAQTGDL